MNIAARFDRLRTLDPWRDNSLALLLGVGLIFMLCAMFYSPALVLGRTLGHGDISLIDMPFFRLFARVMQGQSSALWPNRLALK